MAVANTTLTSSTGYSQTNTTSYAINQMLMNVNTVLPCRIVEITGNTYTIQPLNNTLDANKQPYDPAKIYNVPYSMEVGGNAGFIVELVIDDTVLVGFCQRDISIIKKTWTQQNPGSFRKFSLADAVIIKKVSNTSPTIFVKVTNAGIEISSPSLPVTVNAQNAEINVQEAIINASSSVEVNSPDIKLGASASLGAILENTPLVMNIAGVTPGSGVTGVTATITSGGSTVIKGALA